MIALEVLRNGDKLCTAGLRGGHVLTVILQSVLRSGRGQEIGIDVGGLSSETRMHHRWAEHLPLKVGDEIRVRIVDTDEIDLPTRTYSAESSGE